MFKYKYNRYNQILSFLNIILLGFAFFYINDVYASSDNPSNYSERNHVINQYLDREQHQIDYQKTKKSSKSAIPSYSKALTRRELIEQNMTVKLDEPEKSSSFFPKIKRIKNDHKKYWDKYSFDFSVSVGQRVDELRWDIAGNLDGNSPNVLSELTWSDLKMTQIKTTAKLVYDDQFIVDAMFASADVYEGDNQDSDYLWDNRTWEFSRSNNHSNDGDAIDYSVGLGYKLCFDPKQFLNADQLDLSLLAGYSHHEQKLKMTDGNQTITSIYIGMPLGPFEGLHSTYETEWKGPWLGVELEGKIKKMSGVFRLEYHNVDYYAEADWNLRADFEHPVSFDHTAEGSGLVFNLGLDYELTQNLSIDFKADIQDWSTGHGIDTVYFSSGTRTQTRLNSVDWRSYALMLGSTYHFN